jgi:hypothetical protein
MIVARNTATPVCLLRIIVESPSNTAPTAMMGRHTYTTPTADPTKIKMAKKKQAMPAIRGAITWYTKTVCQSWSRR